MEIKTTTAYIEVPVKYGDYVQMDDRFETVHIWSKELEERNAGRWIPKKISYGTYLSNLLK